jgi:excisionase family DNA binding protein
LPVPSKSELPDVTNIDLDRLHDKFTAAAFLGVSVRTLEIWVKTGRIPVIRVSKRIPRFNLRRVMAAMERFEEREVA